MKWSPTPVDIGPPIVKHAIRGARLADLAVSGIEVLMHRFVKLNRWRLREASDAYCRCYWPISAGGEIILGGMTHPLQPGSLYLIAPHTPFDSNCARAFSKWYIHFTISEPTQHLRPGVTRITPTTRMRALLKELCPPKPTARWQQRAAIRPVAAVELVALVLQNAFAAEQALTPVVDERFAACSALMQQRFTEKLTLKRIAEMAGTSVRTLSDMFVAQTGFPPIHYLIELRLNHAMRLLRHTDQSVEQIAEECGFANRYYLTRMLAKHRQITPAAFRRYRESPIGRQGTKPDAPPADIRFVG